MYISGELPPMPAKRASYSLLKATAIFALVASTASAQPAKPDGKDKEIYEAIGMMFAHGSGMARMGFSAGELENILNGIRKGLGSKELPPEVDRLQPEIQKIMRVKMDVARKAAEQEQEAAAATNKAKAAKYFEALSKQEGIQKDPSGFYYEILKEGTGKQPTMEDTVRLHYHGTLVDGTVFDSSVERGTAASFPMKGVIKGFSGGLTKVKVGGKVRIHIPSELGYGNNPRPGGKIKPGDTLIFECELLGIE